MSRAFHAALSRRSLSAEIWASVKERTNLGLSKFTAEAAQEAAEHRDKLGTTRNARDVAAVHSTLRPDHNQREPILDLALLTGKIQPEGITETEE